MSEQMDEQARELAQQLCSHVNGQYMDPNGIAMIAALLARVRQQALEEAAQLVGSHSVKTLQYVPLELPDLIRSLRQAVGGEK